MTITTNRYDAIDDYIIAEIEYEYLHADRSGKLDILKKIYLGDSDTKYRIPYELAKLFIEKTDDYVLIWLAKNGADFDYRERDYSIKGSEEVYKHPDRNLWEIFENHKNDFVKTAIYENSDYESGILVSTYIDKKLKELNHLQRLAFVRNKFDSPYTLLSIAQKLFDKNEDFQFLTTHEKNELRRAILTNQCLIDYTHDIINDSMGDHSSRGDLNLLWNSIYDCDDYTSRKIAFRMLGGIDKAKASIYKKLLASMIKTDNDDTSFKNIDSNILRYNIIANCSTKDSETLLLGMQDPEFYIMNLAESKYVAKNSNDFKYYLKTFSSTVLQEIFNIIIVIVLVSQFNEVSQLLLICAVIYSYVNLSYKSTKTLISSTQQNLILLSSIKLTKTSKEDILNNDRDLQTAANLLRVATVKLYITGISGFLITIYLVYKFVTAIM